MDSIIKQSKKGYMNRNRWGYTFIFPAILGLLIFYIGPMLYSIIISFTQYTMITPPEWIGIENFTRLFNDELVGKALSVTFYFALLNVPAVTIISLLIAMLLNTKIRHMSIFRTIFYIPSIVPAVANAALWLFIFNPVFGFLNKLVGFLGIPPQQWLYDPKLVIPCFVIMSVWGAGNTMVIYLAGLQGISPELYEAVEIDGGGAVHKFWNVTVPMISPLIFYNVVMCTIGSLQTFTQAFVMTSGGPNNASLFYMLLLYRTAFTNQEMGYASAMAWVLFVIIGILTMLVFKSSNLWVFYEGETRNG
jgi:multiple sugar transport system permease protein